MKFLLLLALFLMLILPGCTTIKYMNNEPVKAALKERKILKEKAWAKYKFEQFQYAKTYCCGEDEIFDTETAISWFCASATKGHREAQFALASIYNGTPSDYYSNGDVSKHIDSVKAYGWFKAGAESGYKKSEPFIDKLEDQLTVIEKAKARRISNSWESYTCPEPKEAWR